MTQEQKDKISKSKEGTFSGEKKPSYGKIWLNNGEVNVYILKSNKEEIDFYISKNYRYGMYKKTKSKY